MDEKRPNTSDTKDKDTSSSSSGYASPIIKPKLLSVPETQIPGSFLKY